MKENRPLLRVALALGASIFLLACGGADDSATQDSAAPQNAEAPEELTATQAQERGLVDRKYPEGGVRIDQEGELITVFARHVARFDVLRRLAIRYRFELVDGSDDDPLVDVFVENGALETALARLIEPTPYTITYAHEAESDQNKIARIVIGNVPEDEAREDRSQARRGGRDDDTDGEEDVRRQRSYTPRSAAERDRRMAERAIRQEQRKAEALEDLSSDDPTTREDAVATGLDSEDPVENALLTDMALHDPNPGVRAEAARQLSFGGATTALGQAFFDPDPDVAVAALDAAAWSARNDELFEAMQEAAGSPNPDIAKAANDAIGFYEMEHGE